MATYISALIHSIQFLGPGPIVRLVLGLKIHELDLTYSPPLLGEWRNMLETGVG